MSDATIRAKALLEAAEQRLRQALPAWAGAEREAALYSLNVGDRFEQAQEAAGKEMNEAFEDFTARSHVTLAVAITLAEAAAGYQETVDLVLDDLVLPLLEKAELTKHDDSKGVLERERQQGIADALRQVRIWLEDNEAVSPRAEACKALAAWESHMEEMT